MSANVTELPDLGKTLLTGHGRTLSAGARAGLEGTTKEFDDKAPGQTSGAEVRRSNRRKVCVFVQNVSGIALEPKRTVTWESGYRMRRVGGYCRTTAAACAGVVDEHLPSSGVPNNDYFWITVKGPSLVKTDLAAGANNLIALDDVLVALTAATSQATTSGRVAPWGLTATSTGTTDGTNQANLMNFLGRALSAKTTSNTNADVLVDLMIMK